MTIPVAFVLPDLGAGGAQRVMLSLASGIDPTRFSSHLMLVGPADSFSGESPEHVVIERLAASRLRTGLPRLIRAIRRQRPRVVVSVMGYVNLALLAIRPLLGCKRLIVREANVLAATKQSLPRWLPMRWAYRGLYPRANAIVVPTERIRAEIARVVPRAAGKIVLMHNPVDEERLRQQATPPVRPRGSGLILVAAGRLTRQKGFDRLVEIMPLLPSDVTLTIFGDGEERDTLEAQIASLGLAKSVTLPGFSSALPAAIAGADLFVLPSRWEGLPNVVLEALALGTPVLASDEAAVEDVARAAGPGAVTIAPLGAAFADAIRGRTPMSTRPPAPRPSLLPAAYRREVIVAQFAALLERIAA